MCTWPSHGGADYMCPICIAIRGEESENTWIKQDDVFYRDGQILGFISSKSIVGNEHHALLVPVEHYEHLYEMPDAVLSAISVLSKRVAQALKEVRSADGVTVAQFNEPAGGQHAFHYHLHVIPRFKGDAFEQELFRAERSAEGGRVEPARMLREWFRELGS